MAYLDRWKILFPETVGSEARPSDPIDDSLAFNTDGFPQFIANDPVRYDLQNAFLMQLFSNDARLGELIDTLDGALEEHKTDTNAHANGISGNSASATKLKNSRTIDGVSFDGTAAIVHYGTCSTAAGTVAKTVACAGFTLVTGAVIFAKFTVTNTATNPTLNVNNTGAKAIQYRGAAITAGYLAANRTYAFVYDGTNYQLIGDLDTNTTYSNMSQSEATTGTATTARSISAAVLHKTAEDEAAKTVTDVATGDNNGTIKVTTNGTAVNIAVKGLAALAYKSSLAKGDVGLGNVDNTADSSKSVSKAATLTTARTIDGVDFNGSAAISHYGVSDTAADTAAKTVACTGFKLVTGAEIVVRFKNTNTADNPTLNVNNTGAKGIHYRQAAINKGYLVNTRMFRFVYDGSNYQMIGDVDTNTTYSNFVKSGSGAKAGLVPAPSTTAGTTKYLREDGTWQVPPDNNTTYSANNGVGL